MSATTDIKYDEPKDLSEISFYQKCVKAIDVFSKLHDVNKTTLVRESIAALEHLKVNAVAMPKSTALSGFAATSD